MYKINNLHYEYEDYLTLAKLVSRHENDKKIIPKKGFGTYIFLNRKLIDKRNMEDIMIKDNDEVVIMPIMSAG